MKWVVDWQYRAAGMLLLIAGASFPASATGEGQSLGKKIYDFYCYQCHAYSGNAKTVAARYLNPRPRDFTSTDAKSLTRERMLAAVRDGRAGTAMTSFARVLDSSEMEAAVDYIRSAFMSENKVSLKYHTKENGWENHQRYETAYEFALGTLPIDTPWDNLNANQRAGKKLFLSACVTCHEPARLDDSPLKFEPRSVSYPRSTDTCVDCHAARPETLLPLSAAVMHPLVDTDNDADFQIQVDASPYFSHRQPGKAKTASQRQLRGRELFLANCAFCHAADGSSRNWIGSFLDPRPRDLQSQEQIRTRSPEHLFNVIRNGLNGTSMPAWKNVLTDEEISNLVDFLSGSTTGLPRSQHPHQQNSGGKRPGLVWQRRDFAN